MADIMMRRHNIISTRHEGLPVCNRRWRDADDGRNGVYGGDEPSTAYDEARTLRDAPRATAVLATHLRLDWKAGLAREETSMVAARVRL